MHNISRSNNQLTFCFGRKKSPLLLPIFGLNKLTKSLTEQRHFGHDYQSMQNSWIFSMSVHGPEPSTGWYSIPLHQYQPYREKTRNMGNIRSNSAYFEFGLSARPARTCLSPRWVDFNRLILVLKEPKSTPKKASV